MHTYTRRPDWPERLADAFRAAAGKPFAWGEWDCVRFSFDCVLAVTGTDPAPDIRGQYDSEESAAAQIARFGADLESGVDALFGARVGPLYARRGDLLMWNGCLGIAADHTGLFVTPRGLVRIGVAKCMCSWRVG